MTAVHVPLLRSYDAANPVEAYSEGLVLSLIEDRAPEPLELCVDLLSGPGQVFLESIEELGLLANSELLVGALGGSGNAIFDILDGGGVGGSRFGIGDRELVHGGSARGQTRGLR